MLEVEIWSDVVCPWCYVGKRRFEAALAGFDHRDRVKVTWRAFELDPEAPRVRDTGQTQAQRLAEKYGRTVEEAEEMLRGMTRTAAAEGLELHFDEAIGGNTFDAHRLIQLAARHGKGDQAEERLMHAHFTEGEAIGDREVLARLGDELGLPEAEVRAMLDGDAYAEAVRQDEAEAAAIGIRGVPCFIIGRRYGVSGAQSPERLREVLEQAWEAQLSGAPAEGG